MKWVLLFFCVIFSIFLFIIIVLVLSTIKLNIKKIYISNYNNGFKKEKLESDALMYFEIYFLGKIKIAKFSLNKNIFSKINLKTDMQKLRNNFKRIKKIKSLDILKKSKLQIEKGFLNVEIGADDVIITAFLVTIISSIAGMLFRSVSEENRAFKVMPLYQYGNVINLNFNCIIKVKMVHIIHVILILIMKGMKKNERTSNRRSYDYSYE